MMFERFAKLRPMPLSTPMRAREAMLGSIAFRKIAAYSMLAPAPTSATITHTSDGPMFGVARNSSAMEGMPTSMQAAIQGLRRPLASAMAPTTGAPMATRAAAMEFA